MEKSYLFVPGNRPERIEKALNSSADAVIIDLEDAVAIEKKREARQLVYNVITKVTPTPKKIYVRVNDIHSPFWEEDVRFTVGHPFSGIVLPKTESAEAVQKLAHELKDGQTIIPLIETAKGITLAYEIASSSKVIRLAFGAMDYCLDLGIAVGTNEQVLHYPRSALVVASRSAGIQPPIDTVYVDIQDIEGLKKETMLAKQLGMFAKLCIHPDQLDIVNRIFTPSDKEIEWAKKVISAFEKAEQQGLGVIHLNGKMIDYSSYKQARLVMQRHIKK